MPGQERGRPLRLRGHCAGVNWRPTRFTDDVPPFHVCDLCRMVSKSTVLLPCSHVLCELCHRASGLEGHKMCPMDGEPFTEVECHIIPMPARQVNSLQAYCWNSELGCNFRGTMEALLHHYEEVCTYHAVECPRCGMSVLHKDLPTHCSSECLIANDSSVNARQVSSQDGAPTVHDINSALQELKTLFKDPYEELIPAFQSQINELVECVKVHSNQLREIECKLERSEQSLKSEMKKVAENIGATSRDALRFQQDAHTSVLPRGSTVRGPVSTAEATERTSLPWHEEKKLILRKLEFFVHQASVFTEKLHQCMKPPAPIVTTFCQRLGPSFVAFMDANLSTTVRDSESTVRAYYLLTVKNADALFEFSGPLHKLATVTKWHKRDTYFNLYLAAGRSNDEDVLCLSLQCGGFLETSCLFSSAFSMALLHEESSKNLVMRKLMSVSPLPGHRFVANLLDIKREGFVKAGELKIMIVVIG